MFRPLERRKTNVLAEVTRQDPSGSREMFEQTGLGKRLNEYRITTPCLPETKPCRTYIAEQSDLMLCNPKLPKREAAEPVPRGVAWKDPPPAG